MQSKAEEPESILDESEPVDAVVASETTRKVLLAQLADVETQYRQNSDDSTIALLYAQTLFKLGNFDEAQTALNPILGTEIPSPEAIYLAAQLEYLHGRYAKAEELYHYLAKNYYDELRFGCGIRVANGVL